MKKILLIILVIIMTSLSACAPKLDTYDSSGNSSDSLMVKNILDEIKDVHPGTAGNSLKSLFVLKDIMSMSGSNEYINTAMQEYVDSMSKEEKIDFSDSVKAINQRFTDIDENDINGIFYDEGIDLGGKEFNKSDYSYAEKFIDTLFDIAVRDYSND